MKLGMVLELKKQEAASMRAGRWAVFWGALSECAPMERTTQLLGAWSSQISARDETSRLQNCSTVKTEKNTVVYLRPFFFCSD